MPKLPSLTEVVLMSDTATSRSLWDEYCDMRLVRSDSLQLYKDSVLDPGVNYFVLMLEQLGAKTEFSCEGHPDFDQPGSFYVLFYAPLELALKIRACGFFSVELEGPDCWSIRRVFPDVIQKEGCLRFAALQWRDHFGPIVNPKLKIAAKKPAKKSAKKRVPKRLR